ncbi:neprilysin-like 9 [Cochliomyia hominivorax]
MDLKLKLKSKPSSELFVIVILILNSNLVRLMASASAQNFTYIYRDYLKNMVKIMEHDVEPCGNFFQHACGNFENYQKDLEVEQGIGEEDYLLYRDQDVVPFLYNKQDYYMFFKTHKERFNTPPGILVRNVYDQCKKFQVLKMKKRKIWLRLINDIDFLKHDHDLLRKWPFLHYQWEKYEKQLDLNWPALAAEFSAHGLQIFFNIFFAEHTIYVTPNDDLQCYDLNEFKLSVLPLLGSRNAQIADIIGLELWLLCRQLKGEVAISAEIDKISNLIMDDTMSEFFQRLFPRLNFSDVEIENSRKIMIHIDKLSQIMTLLRNTNPRIIYNFILWQAYQQLTSIEDCFSLITEFEELLDVEYWNWFVFDKHFSRDVALASYLFHTTRFQKYYKQIITSSSWERLFQSRSERKDLNIERSIKNYAKQYLDLEKFSESFNVNMLKHERLPFFAQLLALRNRKLRHTFLNPSPDNEDLNFFKQFINFSILLVYRPRLHYFASYDREMWQNSKLLQDSDKYYAAIDCLQHQTSLHIEESDLYEQLSMQQVNDIYNFYTAFVESLEDYKFWLESENFAIAEDFILEYFKLNSSSVIFYAVAQQYCGRNDLFYSPLINRSFMNMPEFQEEFKCFTMDDMNPVTKCLMNKNV